MIKLSCKSSTESLFCTRQHWTPRVEVNETWALVLCRRGRQAGGQWWCSGKCSVVQMPLHLWWRRRRLFSITEVPRASDHLLCAIPNACTVTVYFADEETEAHRSNAQNCTWIRVCLSPTFPICCVSKVLLGTPGCLFMWKPWKSWAAHLEDPPRAW